LSRPWSFDPIVRVLSGVVEAVGEELIDDGEQGPSSIGHDLGWIAMHTKRSLEEPSRGPRVAPRRDEYVDDLTVLVDSPVDVAP
jgi:hypothetical protein